jgi:hypothetical protein
MTNGSESAAVGAISESSSIPSQRGFVAGEPVMFPLGRSSRAPIPLATGSATFAKDDRDRPRRPQDGSVGWAPLPT